MKYLNVSKAKSVYAAGGNVTEFLRKETGSPVNTSEIIEIAYDLQAGSYIEGVQANMGQAKAYAGELAGLLAPHMEDGKTLLDVGTGEMTTLSLLLASLDQKIGTAFAFDISWSRLYKGLGFSRSLLKDQSSLITPFVADMKAIPLADKCIDVVTSNHALEPNGGNLSGLLTELFRVCREKLVLFEPSYELNSDEGRQRMDRLGYIKDIEGAVAKLGGSLLDVVPVPNVANPLNPTACYVIEPAKNDFLSVGPSGERAAFTVPGTAFELMKTDGFWYSKETGLAFPELKGIPVLKSDNGILASHLG
ncbi:class I SAM-dependent methyltransferase [uncultured Roseibium sp.]|uniref:class I SAM-dependent methyltransferase n=1 Tax=uncultured Roseibium sp. TaxID=1936171 RepID=UPI0032164970